LHCRRQKICRRFAIRRRRKLKPDSWPGPIGSAQDWRLHPIIEPDSYLRIGKVRLLRRKMLVACLTSVHAVVSARCE
jgi:hypothetical protein